MSKKWFLILLVLGVVLRFFHLGESIESPHMWRQSDTANYIWDFYQNGIDLLHPSVCWMGEYKTVILEFPLIEGIVATAYHVFGPYHAIAKIIFLLFFLASCYYFYKLIRLFISAEVARVATILYLFSPLSIFFSRAIHIDFAEMFFVFGMSYHFIVGIQNRDLRSGLFGSLFAILAFMTKAPYAIVFFFPILYIILKERQFLFVLKTAYIYVLPVLIFILWQQHVFEVNSNAPDWDFIPGYRKFVHNSGWYYGAWSQREDWNNWSLLGNRILFEVTGIIGLILVGLGMIFGKVKAFFWWWLFGVIVYVLIFFNLNRIHNYYQIPFAPILSVFSALGIAFLSTLFKDKMKSILIISLVVLIGLENGYYAFSNYFVQQPVFEELGQIIQEETNENDIVITNINELDSKFPNVHYAARRNGWQIPNYGLESQLIYKLMLEGADYFVTIRYEEIQGDIGNFLAPFELVKRNHSDGRTVYIYKTDFHQLWSMMPESEKEKVKRKLPDENFEE